MSKIEFLPLALLGGAAFGCALLWVLTQWIRAGDIAGSVDREVHRNVHRPKLGEPGAPREVEAELAAERAEEAFLGPRMWWWGLFGTIFGMLVGGVAYGFVGALLGAVGGSFLAVVGVIVAFSLFGPVAAAEAAEERARAEADGPEGAAVHATIRSDDSAPVHP